jgi:hypothetical protein
MIAFCRPPLCSRELTRPSTEKPFPMSAARCLSQADRDTFGPRLLPWPTSAQIDAPYSDIPAAAFRRIYPPNDRRLTCGIVPSVLEVMHLMDMNQRYIIHKSRPLLRAADTARKPARLPSVRDSTSIARGGHSRGISVVAKGYTSREIPAGVARAHETQSYLRGRARICACRTLTQGHEHTEPRPNGRRAYIDHPPPSARKDMTAARSVSARVRASSSWATSDWRSASSTSVRLLAPAR